MRDAGINTLRIYGTETNEIQHLAAMDAMVAVHPNLKFFVNDFITYDSDYSVATGGANRTQKITDFVSLVRIFMKRPYVIGYAFGNENNLPNHRGSSINSESDVNTTIADWYSLVNAAIAAGKAIDSTRFFTTVDAEVGTYPGDATMTNLDVVSLNLYRGTTFTDILQDVLALTTKPVLITEWGRSRTSNAQSALDTQASECGALITEVETYKPFISGHFPFKYTDSSTPSVGNPVFGATGPLSHNEVRVRDVYPLYTTLKTYMTTHSYGGH